MSDMARIAQDAVGQRLVAYVTGSRSSAAVGAWAAGTKEVPTYRARVRLAQLYEVIWVLQASYADDTIKTWMSSPNPDLGDEIPGDLLRAGESARVLGAAHAFVDV